MTPEEFLAAAERARVVLDVRARASLRRTSSWSGVVSLVHRRRTRGGRTAYKQVGKQKAIDEGLEFVAPKLQSLAARARGLFEAQASPTPLAAIVGVAACEAEAWIGCSARRKSPP